MKNKKIYVIVSMVLSMLIYFGNSSNTVEASELNFNVTPIIPDNQVDKEKTYYDIKLDKNKEQALEVKLENKTKKDVVIELDLNRATTNINGIVEYGEAKANEDSSLIHDIKSIIKIETPEVTLKSGEEKIVKLIVKTPKEDFDGVLAGGLTFKEKNTDDKKEDKEATGLAIKNEFAFLVGLVIHGSKEEDDIESELVMNKVAAGQLNSRNMILANLQNVQPKYVNKMEINAIVTKKGEPAVLYKNNKKDLQMAPNSNFDYGIPLNGKKLNPGTYILKTEVKSSSGSWNFEKEFKITANQAKTLNNKDVTIPVNNTWLYILIAIGVLVLIQVTFICIRKIYKKNQKNKKSKKKKRKETRGRKKTKNY